MILSMLRAFNLVKQCQAKVTRTRSNPRSLHRNPSYFVWCFIQNHQNDICRSFYCTQTEGHRPGQLSAVFGNRQSLHPCWQVLCRVARLWLWVIVLGERNPSEVHECFQPSTVFASVSRYSNGRGWSNVLTCRDMSWHVVVAVGDYQPAYNAELWEPSGLALDKDQKSLGDFRRQACRSAKSTKGTGAKRC